MNARLACMALIPAAALAGCGTTPYSQLSGQRYFKAPLDTYPVLILDVDGRSTASNPVLVDPGKRIVSVQAPPGAAGAWKVRQITLDVPPCTRLYLVAVKANRLASDFEVKVEHQESIGGCELKVAQR